MKNRRGWFRLRQVITLLCAIALAAMSAASLLALMADGAAGEACGQQPCTWNFGQARIPAAQPLGRAGAGVTVAVVDTWADAAHPDFGGRVVDSADCAGGGGACRDHVSTSDGCVHGTHVAGTVASAHYGVAPQARILAVRVLTYDRGTGECAGSTADVAAGIRFAAAHGARVINLSLAGAVPGLFQSSDVTGAVTAAAHAGAVVIFAAGNSTAPITDSYGTDALLVAATGPDGNLAGYSSRGGSVALAAPGGGDATGISSCRPDTCIVSTLPGNNYGLLEGTSMAAPHVSGTAALLFAQDPSRDREAVIDALTSTARPLPGAGHGLLDAAAALHRTMQATSTRPASGRSGAELTRNHFAGALPSTVDTPGYASLPGPVRNENPNPGQGSAAVPDDPTPAPAQYADNQRARNAAEQGGVPWAVAAVIVIILLLGAIATWHTVKT